MQFVSPELLYFIFNAVLGSLTYCLLWKEFNKIEMLRRIGLSAIAGYVYYLLVQRYQFPDGLMSFVVGYFAIDFLEGFFEKWGQNVREKVKS